MAVVAKFPGTAGVSALALTDVGGEMSGIPFNEWTANGATTAVAVAPFSLVSNEAIDTTVPTQGWVTTANGEVLHYSTYVAGTKTFTIDARAQFGTVAAAIDTGSAFGQWLNKQQWNQIVAEIISMQTKLLVGDAPNLVLNSDFSRRTVFGLAMPEVFADLSGTTKIDGGAAGAVAANIFTQGAANNEYAWCAGSFVWRDFRASATFKATSTTGIYNLTQRVSATDYVMVSMNNGVLRLTKVIASASTVVASQAQALTLNRWYWIEIESQGTTFIVKVYDTGGTVPGVTKASSTLLQTVTGTVADASVAVGRHISITSDQAAAQWGGIATGNGGVYVETWLPESCVVTPLNTLGGQAVGFDESADAGPNGKQWALRCYIPATSRRMEVLIGPATLLGWYVAPSTAYTGSAYVKTSGKAGAGALVTVNVGQATVAGSGSTLTPLTDAGETSWTRKTGTATSAATTRYGYMDIIFGDNSTTTGTGFVMLGQYEQGSAATAWRGAPADDAPIVWENKKLTDTTTTSAAAVNADDRDLAGNFFLPWDANVVIESSGSWYNSGANTIDIGATVDGSYIDSNFSLRDTMTGAAVIVPFAFGRRSSLAAGKHRIALGWRTSAGTATLYGSGVTSILRITATRGK